MGSKVPSQETSSLWTNEKHLKYLDNMEASFVRAMFENKGRLRRLLHLPDHPNHLPPDNQYSSDHRNYYCVNNIITAEKHSSHNPSLSLSLSLPAYTGPRAGKMEGRVDRRIRRQVSSQSSEDQVVPQLECREHGEDNAS